MKQILLALIFLAASLPARDSISSGPVRIFLAGDSTMAEKLPEKRPETGWGEMLQAWFPEAAILARPGDSHGLKPVGNDLMLIIVYEIKDAKG